MKKTILCFMLMFGVCGLCCADQVFLDVQICTDEAVGYTCIGTGVYLLTIGAQVSTVGGALLVAFGLRLIFI